MYVVVEGWHKEANIIGIVADRDDIPEGVLSQQKISVREVSEMPDIPIGEFVWGVYIKPTRGHTAHRITVYTYQTERPWENNSVKYRLVIAKDSEAAIERALEEECTS